MSGSRGLSDDLAAVTGGNARRLFFIRPLHPVHEPVLPEWLRDYPPPGPVTLSPTAPLQLPIDLYRALYDAYCERNRPEAPLILCRLCHRAPAGSARFLETIRRPLKEIP